MKEIIIIDKPHSVVDLITNSSTEIFVTDDERDITIIREIVKSIEKYYPNDYGYMFSVDYCDSGDIENMLGYYSEEDFDNIIKILKVKGYQIIPPIEEKNETCNYIKIYAERGGHDTRLVDFIKTNFNIVYNSSDY